MSLESETKVQPSKEKISNTNGMLVILTGYPGAGKTEIRSNLIARNPAFRQLVTTASREKRSDETEGVSYYFVSEEEFLEKVKNNEFVEYVWFPGKDTMTLRGTTKKELERIFNGQSLISTMDVEGAGKFEDTIRKVYEEDKAREILSRTINVFIDGGPEKVLQKRFTSREDGTVEEFKARIKKDKYFYAIYSERFIKVPNYEGKFEDTIQRMGKLIELSSRK